MDNNVILYKNCIYIHFKHENMSANESINKYLYKLIDIAKHTETNETLVIYQNIESGKLYARPYDMFISKVDRTKYPNIKQEYRMEMYEVLERVIIE